MNKKLLSLIAGAAIVAAATGCSGTATSSVAGTSSAAGTSASEASSTAAEELSGTLSMNGSTSMEKVIKAVNGGGGRGMRMVASMDELDQAYSLAKSEALKAFGSDEIYLEKYLQNPKHIEVQLSLIHI